MRLHFFWTGRSDGEEFAIFAKSRLRAIEIFEAIRETPEEIPIPWKGTEFERWKELGEPDHLIEALARNEEGVGAYDHRAGWTIIPLWKDAPPLYQLY